MERREDVGVLLGIEPPDEENMTGPNVFDATKALDHERTTTDDLSPDDVIEDATEGIVAKNTNDDVGPSIGKRANGPLNELGEIEEEDRLDFGLLHADRLGLRPLRPKRPDGGNQHKGGDPEGCGPTPAVSQKTVHGATFGERTHRL